MGESSNNEDEVNSVLAPLPLTFSVDESEAGPQYDDTYVDLEMDAIDCQQGIVSGHMDLLQQRQAHLAEASHENDKQLLNEEQFNQAFMLNVSVSSCSCFV